MDLFLIQYLRAEADLADDKARRLRAQADALVDEYGDLPPNFELGVAELPPVDEHGVPKYNGRKRGRKKKQRKRRHDPSRPKRQHTAYTLFVQETYPNVKAQYQATNTAVKSNELISVVARQWGALSPEEKEDWKQRALATAILDEEAEQQEDDEEDDEEDALDEEDEEDYDRKKRGRPRKK